MSRYYDPEVCRFISADDEDVPSVQQGNLNQHNLYAYSLDNPINRIDEGGQLYIPNWAKATIGIATVAGLAVATALTGGAVGVICGAALTGSIIGSGIGAGIGFAEDGIDGAFTGFAAGSVIGGAVGGALAWANISLGGIEIVGSAQKTHTAFHRMASNIQAGKLAMQPGRYSKITFDRALKTAGLNGRKRPDVIGIARYGKSKLIEVVSKSQTGAQMRSKCKLMELMNPNTKGIVISWPGRKSNFWRNLLK